MNPMHFFLDFDGTVTTDDAVDRILEKFADKKWLAIENEWAEGKIGSRECLERQIACLGGTPDEIRAELRQIGVDPGFVPFLRATQSLAVPVTIVSDSFDFFIEEILKETLKDIPHLLKGVPIYSNTLVYEAGKWKASFPHDVMCHHGCANCKPVIMKKLAARADTVLLVGDGLSDRYAAKKAALTFAKGKLVDICRQNNYPHRRISGFHDVQKWLEDAHAKSARDGKPKWYEFWKGFSWRTKKSF